MKISKIVSILGVGVLLMLGSCTKEIITPTNPLSSAVVGVSNDPDDLSIGIAKMNDVTDAVTYEVAISSDSIDVSVGATLTSGSVIMEILNADGSVVIEKKFIGIMAHTALYTITGSQITVNLEFENASGEIGINVEKTE